jgi:5-methylcytosine-specific restriction enzyme subunit McrC
MCRFFLSESYLSREAGNLQNLSFLIPMEYVFEDFIAGFLDRHFGDRYQVNYQAHNWLTDQNVFQIRHDLILTDRVTHAKLIIDTKYKLRNRKKDSKKGISQTDLYQMVSYALRANCNTVLLLYPYYAGNTLEPDQFTVSSEMIPGQNIRIFAADVPMVFDDLKRADMELGGRLKGILEGIVSEDKAG